MKKLLLILLLTISFTGQSNAEECYYIDDNYGNYGYYTESGKECGPSRGGGGLGDWSGTDSIGSWLGLILILSFIGWIIWGVINEREGEKKETLGKKLGSEASSNKSYRKFVVHDVKEEVASQVKKGNSSFGRKFAYAILFIWFFSFFIVGVLDL